MRTLVRAPIALVAIGAIAAVTASCSAVRPPALTVNGNDLSRDSVDRQLSAIADNPGLKNEIAATEGTIKSGGSTIWLTQVVEQQVIDQQVRRRNIRVTSADRQAAAARAANFFGGQVFAEFPRWFRAQVLAGYARREALSRKIETPVVTDDTVRAAYDVAIGQLRAQCPSGRFVSHIIVPSRPQADALAAQIRAGTSFEQLARQQSIDQGSAPNGGELGCLDGQQLVSQAVRSQPLNEVSAPVPARGGWQLVLVRDTIPFEVLEPSLRQQIQPRSTDTQPQLVELVARARVDVDPRYGRWVVRGGRGTVQPPRGAPRTMTAPPPTTTPEPVP